MYFVVAVADGMVREPIQGADGREGLHNPTSSNLGAPAIKDVPVSKVPGGKTWQVRWRRDHDSDIKRVASPLPWSPEGG